MFYKKGKNGKVNNYIDEDVLSLMQENKKVKIFVNEFQIEGLYIIFSLMKLTPSLDKKTALSKWIGAFQGKFPKKNWKKEPNKIRVELMSDATKIFVFDNIIEP